ncbi:hypothetical protein SUNI508_04450 [Seiridium unicorne]|uniref:Zn(2)-C6 fungal-type domain-containing protein n=1 Tax=Seiridium unicorne TaxID=138068 RepID=A0ABR2V8R0_9PEZI
MSVAGVPPACAACSRAKRKCGKQRPSCERCTKRGVACKYSASRTSRFVLLEEPTAIEKEKPVQTPACQPRPANNTGPVLYGDAVTAPFSPFFDLSISPSASLDSVFSANWFLSPETWVVDHRASENVAPVGGAALKGFVSLIQRWFEQWVESGSNPFIHSHLYRTQFPGCLQVAYVTMSSYTTRTDGNAEIILRIVQDRADELLRERGVATDGFGPESSVDAKVLGIIEQLARLHALMVYQVICLFDGDIRSRHVAEKRIFALYSWATELVESAGQAFSDIFATSDPVELALLNFPGVQASASCLEQRWQAWILAESVRRTWLVATAIYAVYLIMQQSWILCPGGIMFTNGQGLWDAKSASEWDKLWSGGDAKFLQRFDADRFFTEANPTEIDEFGKVMLEVTFGFDKVKKWTL